MKNSTMTHSLGLCLAGTLLIILCADSGPLLAGKPQNLELPASSIHRVVQNMVWNELEASEHPTHYYRYIERDISSDGSRTSDQIATPHGIVDRLISVDEHLPDQQQLEKNQQLLANLAVDTQLQQSRLNDQQSDIERRNNVIRDVPNAFLFTYAGRDPRGSIMLKFRPDPDFKPSSRQSLILQGMAGVMWIDPVTQRMVKIDGTLTKAVKIGWGFLARFNEGGTFLIEQSQGPDGTWHQALLSVHFDGTVLIFKHIHIQETQVRCCFERVPDNLAIPEAVHLLQTETDLPKDWPSRLDAIRETSGPN